jgi:hypothetical protein
MFDDNPFSAIHIVDDKEYRPIFCDYAATYVYSHLSQKALWPHLKIIGVTKAGGIDLLCDGNVQEKKPDQEPEKEPFTEEEN